MKLPNIWRVATVEEQPSLTLIRWSILETDAGTRHLVGFCPQNMEGRVSSAIVRFDPGSMRCITGSGRVYQMEGAPGYDDDGAYVWEAWMRINSVNAWIDVTGAVLGIDNKNAPNSG